MAVTADVGVIVGTAASDGEELVFVCVWGLLQPLINNNDAINIVIDSLLALITALLKANSLYLV